MAEDLEIKAMIAISGAFDDLEDAEQMRVLRWAFDKFSSTPLPDPKGSSKVHRSGSGGEGGDEEQTAPQDYDDFAELYDAAAPKSDADKALVAAYWHQRYQGNDQFGSQPLNNYLKDLGHQLKRINDALAAGIKTSPARVLQVRKSGNAPQGRKMYKLSKEGLKAVERMIAGDAE